MKASRSKPEASRPGGTRWRWPTHLFNGRIRTSTVMLIIAFLAVWWVYDTYRLQPTPPAAPQVVPPGFIPDPAYTWVPRTRLQQPSTVSETPTPTTTETTSPTEPPTSEPLIPTPVPGFSFCPPFCPPPAPPEQPGHSPAPGSPPSPAVPGLPMPSAPQGPVTSQPVAP